MIYEPFKIGPVNIRNRVILAPMSGVSDLPFRRLAWRFGAGLVVTEMVASRELVCDSAESWVRLRGDGTAPHMVQLAGREAQWMAEAAVIAELQGADVIDINMGCPAKKVTGGYSGSALMRDLDHALRLIEATVNAVQIPITVKMRLGWDENTINAAELAQRAESAGAQMITVHGRTRSQFYKGRADWSAIGAVRSAIDVPLVANGDVNTALDIEKICQASGADAVMIGRGAQGRPWLCGQLAGNADIPVTPDEICGVVIEHYEMNLSHYGKDVGTRHSRKHLGWYLQQHVTNCSGALKSEIMTGLDPQKVIVAVRQAFSCQSVEVTAVQVAA